MRLLKANEIECRVGQFTKDKSKYSVLLYKTARTDMAVLDETYGESNWQIEYNMVGAQMFCTIAIWDSEKGQWIKKQSNGTESNMEAEKGQASDAMKRAGFMVGIGRELYSAPKIWLDATVNQYELEVADIGYNDNREINRLVITSKGKTVFEMGKPNKSITIGKPETTSEINTVKVKPETKPEGANGSAEAHTEIPEYKKLWNQLVDFCGDESKVIEACKSNGVSKKTELTPFLFARIKNILEVA